MDCEESTTYNVAEIRLHEHPDLDAMAALWLAKRFGQKVFINIDFAPVTFWPQQSMAESADELEAKGVICFDVGEGRFDHHPHGKCIDKCAADLVAEFLGINNDIALTRILGYVRLHDLEGPTSTTRSLRENGVCEDLVSKVSLLESFSFASLSFGQKNNLKTINAVHQQLDNSFQQQLHFWTTVKEEFLNKAAVFSIVIPDATDGQFGFKTIKVAVIESDVREVGSFSRTAEGGYCQVCVHREPKSQHTFISGQLRSEQFVEIAKILRVTEMQQRGIELPFRRSDLSTSWMELCPIWYLPINIRGEVYIIMNGGQKAKEVEPSILTLEQIKQAIDVGLNTKVLYPDCPKNHCLGPTCPMYPYGLNRCAQIASTGS